MSEEKNAIYNKYSDLCSLLLSITLNSINNNGSLQSCDKDSDLLTHHLLLTLKGWNDGILNSIIDRSIEWFVNIDDYREKKDNDFNPFKLRALMDYKNRNELKNYLDVKTEALKNYHVKADNYAILDLHFKRAGDVADVFPTLVASEILLLHGSDESIKVATDSIDWCKKQIDHKKVYQNLSSILGYVALVVTRYEAITGKTDYQKWRETLLKVIINTQKSGIWESSLYQSFYVFYDLSYINSILKRKDINESIKQFLEKIEPNIFDNKEIYGQKFYIITCCTLRGFDLLLTDSQKKNILIKVFNKMRCKSSEFFHLRHYLKKEKIFYDKFLKDHHDKKFIPINPSIFTGRSIQLIKDQVFILMPFGEKTWINKFGKNETYDFDIPYKELIEPAIKKLNLLPIRADSIFAPHPFMERIWRQINESGLIIADVTSSNPNVLYELGIGHTLGKPIIIITQDRDYVPTDLKAVEFIEYKCQLGAGKNFKQQLKKAINQTLENRYDF